MNNFISSFSLYEFLRILMPGTYLTLNISEFVRYIYPEYGKITSGARFNQVEATIIFAIVSVIMGVFIYSIDNPRILGYIFKNLPSNIIKKSHPNANSITVLNSYFSFYDSLPDAVKIKTEKQSGFLHLALNMAFVNIVSLILVIIVILLEKPEAEQIIHFMAHFIMLLFLLMICIISAYLIYAKRLKYTYERSVELYFKSEEYKKLIENLA